MKSDAHGDLNDDFTWGALGRAISGEVVDAVIFAPPSGSFVDQPTALLPALRSTDGQGLFGVADLLAGLKTAVTSENLLWMRTAE